MKKFNAGVEKLSPRRVSRKAWYERSDSKKDDITTDKPQVMRMVFFKTSDHRVTSGDDSMNCSPQLARTFTEDDDDIFDEEPKSEEVPVAFFQAIGEKQKPEEDPAVTTFFEMMDEKLKPLDSPVHFRKLLPGNPSSRLEDDNELEEKSNLEPYPMCCWEQQSSLPSACRDDDDYESENKSNPEGDLVSSSCLGDDDEFTEKSHPELYSVSYLKQLPSSLSSGGHEDDDEFEEKSKPEEDQVCHTNGQVSHAEVTLMHTKKEKRWVLNKLSKVLYRRKSVSEKLFFETVTEKPKSEKDPVYAEEPLSQTSPPPSTPIKVTEMPMMAEVTETEVPTPVVSNRKNDGRKKLSRALLDCDDDSVTA
jgi:hypothetical protein